MTDTLTTRGKLLRFGDKRESDNRFVRECQKGDEAAWNELITLHKRYVFNLCYRFTRRACEAEDLTQEVFLRVFCTLRTFCPDELSFLAWLTTLTRNLLIDNYRRTRRQPPLVSLECPAQGAGKVASGSDRPDQVYARREAGKILRVALRKVRPYLRETVSLYEIHELGYAEIAQVQRIPIGTVKSRIYKGRAALAHVLRTNKRAA